MDKETAIITNLSKVDWNFTGIQTPKLSIHSLHYFPGNFIFQIPYYFISTLSEKGDVVLDPFCGSGTTGIEACLQGRKSYISDNNRIAILIAEAKKIILKDRTIVSDLLKLHSNLYMWSGSPCPQMKVNRGDRDVDELKKWYHPDTLAQLNYIWSEIIRIQKPDSKKVFEIIFSELLFTCTSTGRSTTRYGGIRRHHWGWVADNVTPKEKIIHNAIKIYIDKLNYLIDITKKYCGLCNEEITIKKEDCKSLSLPDNSIDVIITSPPYVSMTDYAMANRMFYLWMGWQLYEERENEIGARYKRYRKAVCEDYLKEMEICCEEMRRVLKPGKYCAIVLGASRKYSNAVDDVLNIFKRYFSLFWGPELRKTTRARVSERMGTSAREIVCVFQKR